jgi:GT2 family glycosyltransferase
MVIISILTFNKLELTKKCLESVFKTSNVEYKVVVSDNGSTDGTIEYLSSLKNIQVILNNENVGFSNGHNQVMKMYDKSDIVLMNNDLEVPPEWLYILKKELTENDYAAVSPAIQTPNGLNVGAVLDKRAKGRSLINDFVTEPNWVTGSCFYISRKTINRVGLLDFNYIFYYEDVDYCFRIKQMGMKFKCIPEVVIKHHDSASSTPERKKKLMEDSRVYFARKWGYDV